jgi:hypothetical protein
LRTDIRFLTFVFLLLISGFCAFEAEGYEFRIQPAIALSEEYNDNVFLAPNDRRNDYITSVVPSVRFAYKAPLWDWDVNYAYSYRYYARNTIDTDKTHTLNLANQTRIIKEFFFFTMKDDYAKVSLDATRDFTQESNFVNQSDRNILTANPYFVLKPSSAATLNTGYIYTNTWYKDTAAIDKTDHIGYGEMKQELSPRSTMTVSFRYTRNENDVQNYSKSDLFAGPKYEYAEGSTLFFTLGGSRFSFEKTGTTNQVYWDAGITHAYSTMTLSFETGLSYIEDPLRALRREDRYVATIKKNTERTSLVASVGLWEYRDAETKHLETTSYRTNGTISHAVTQNLKGIFTYTVERLEDNRMDTYTSRYLPGARFDYRSSETLTMSLDYRYTNNYSPDIYTNNYYSNRVMVEIKKTF